MKILTDKKLNYICLFMIGVFLIGCKQKRNERRIECKWEIEECNIDGIGRLISNDYYTRATFEFTDDGIFKQSWQRDSITANGTVTVTDTTAGNWVVENDELQLSYFNSGSIIQNLLDDTTSTENYDIYQLDKNDMILEDVSTNGETIRIVATER